MDFIMAHFHRPWARCSARWFYSFLADRPSQTGMQGICGLLALDPLLRDIAPNLPATHTIPTFHFGPTEPLCRQNVDIRAGITAVIGIGDGCEKGVPSLCQGVPGRLIAGKLVTNVSTGGGGTGTHRSPLSRGTPTLLCPGG